jgi:hypothetical protein
MTAVANTRPLRMTPALGARDPIAAYWLGQVHARLRRELAWAWVERGGATDAVGHPPYTDRAAHAVDLVRRADEKQAFFERDAVSRPPYTDRAAHAVDLVRHADEKQAFFERDAAARYLSARIAEPEPALPASPPRGGFAWVCGALALAPIDRFWLALALAGATDAAVGSVMAACANDPARTRPTLALAQQLWPAPTAVARLADPAHTLHRHGLVRFAGAHAEWDAAAIVPAPVAARMLDGDPTPPASLVPCSDEPSAARDVFAGADTLEHLRVVEFHAPRGDAEAAAGALARSCGRTVLRVRDELAGSRDHLDAVAAWAWLAGVDLFLPEAFVADGGAVLPRESIPITVFLDAGESARRPRSPERLVAASVRVPPPDHAGRVAAWTAALGPRAADAGATGAIGECARRFRVGRAEIARIARALPAGAAITSDVLGAACRRALRIDFGDLAEAIEPRFAPDDLVLPSAARRAFDEVLGAMRALTEVHHGWGTAHAWRDAGISVLFAGPSGTGKTMAAECLARALDLPLHRVDLSQVVDKYVGETEKNLRRVFDAADHGDVVLFLDEAEAIFGRRMEARSAQDRWANLEISYLLTRMETARGLTILATNRKDDFDAAFVRRLRYVVQFPLPDADARARIWRQCLPPGADASAVDLEWLARRFVLTGGQIRSAMFNACLQSAAAGAGERRLAMDAVVLAVWRELHKQDGSVGSSQFGPYAELVRAVETPR